MGTTPEPSETIGKSFAAYPSEIISWDEAATAGSAVSRIRIIFFILRVFG
jgi:hypothetical protein